MSLSATNNRKSKSANPSLARESVLTYASVSPKPSVLLHQKTDVLDYNIFPTCSYNPEIRLDANDRAHRNLQHKAQDICSKKK